MFLEVKKKMIDKGISAAELSRLSGIPLPTLYAKLSGRGEFKLCEAVKIKQILEVADMPIEQLFERR